MAIAPGVATADPGPGVGMGVGATDPEVTVADAAVDPGGPPIVTAGTTYAGVPTRLSDVGESICTSVLLILLLLVVVLILLGWVCRLLWIWLCMRGDMNVGLGVPATNDDAEGVEATVGEVGSMVRAPKPVVLACVERVSSCVSRFAVSPTMLREDDDVGGLSCKLFFSIVTHYSECQSLSTSVFFSVCHPLPLPMASCCEYGCLNDSSLQTYMKTLLC